MRYDAAGRLRFEVADVDRDHVAPTGTDPAGWDDDDRVVEHRYTNAGRPFEVLRPPVDVTSFNWGQPPTAEVQTVTVTATGGTWKLRVGAETTAALAHDATAAQVEAVLDALAGIDDGEVAVTAGTGSANTKVHVLTWAAAAGNVASPTADTAALTGTAPNVTPVIVPAASVATTTNGSAPRVTRYGYDDAGRQTSADVPLAPSATTTYWPDGQTRRQTTPGGNFTEFDYDPAGRVIATTTPSPTGTNPTTVTATTTYTPRGEVATSTDPYPTGGTAPAPSAFSYWPDGNLRTAADPRAHPAAGASQNADAVVSYSYDGRGNRTRISSNAYASSNVTTPTALVRRFTYNLDDQPLTEQRVAWASSATRSLATHTYDPTTGRRLSTVFDDSPGDRQVTFTYWNSGRVRTAAYKRVNATSVETTVEEFYDTFGQRTRMIGPGGNTDYTWDGDGNVVGFSAPGTQGLNYARTWDLDHNSTSITYNPGSATREFKFQTGHDQFGRVLRTDVYVPQIQGWWPLAEYTYDLDGNPSREVVNSVIGTRSWGYAGNGWSQPTSYVQDRASGTGDLTQTLSWRPDGRLGSSTYNPGTIGAGGPPASSNYAGAFGYDPAGQLTSVGVTGTGYSSSTTYTYDPMGHRLKEVGSTTAGGSTTSATTYFKWFADRDGLQYTGPSPSVAARSFSWGFGGSLQGVTDQANSSASESMSYDARGLPREYRTGAGDALAATRTYDGDGRLSRVAVAGGTTYDFSWDPTLDVPEVLEVYTATTTWTRLAYGNERVGFEYLNNGSSVGFGIYGYDVQGSAIQTSSASAPAGYGPFGAATSPPAGDMFFGYRGELHIGGRIHLRNRDYDPTLGMFTSPDPVEGQPGTPTANAAYPYANNDPTNTVDPLGLFGVPPVPPDTMQNLLQGGISLAGSAAGALAADSAVAGTAAGCTIFGVGCVAAVVVIGLVLIGEYLLFRYTRQQSLPALPGTQPWVNPTAPTTADVPVGPRVAVDDGEQCDPPPGYIDKHGRIRRRSGTCEAHHIIQNRTMFEADGRTKIYPNYTRYSAPAIVLTHEAHLEANRAQNGSLLGGSYGEEVEVAIDALRAAQMSARIPEAISRADAYFLDVVGLREEEGYDSRTFRPLNRP